MYIDDVHYFGGDFYHFNRAPITLHLAPGEHTIDVRIVRDVRAMGGVGNPTVNVDLILQQSLGPLHTSLHSQGGFIIPDSIGSATDSVLASPFGSVLVRNDANVDIVVSGITASHDICLADLLGEVRIVPGQSRPLAFRLECIQGTRRDFKLDFHYRLRGDEQLQTLSLAVTSPLRGSREPHKITFLHPGGVVSYAILRPPSQNAENAVPKNSSLPIFLALHGAGLEADSEEMRSSFTELPDLPAWVLFPTGGTPWSGDDWHTWGSVDVEAAIATIPDWIDRHHWKGPAANIQRWVVSGHSNGGQGTWYTLLHRPDKVFAAAPISGYSSIQNYVPYTFWHPADPGRTAIHQAALGSYRHELLLPNAGGIPVFQQHGGADDNVPPYHSRQMSQLIREAGANSTYHEIPGMPHWWDGVFTTDPLRHFYKKQVALATVKLETDFFDVPGFSLVVINPGDTGPKYGFKITQLQVPGRYGRFDVEVNALTRQCSLRTSNVRMGYIPPSVAKCSQLMIDGRLMDLSTSKHLTEIWIVKSESDEWHVKALEPATTPVIFPRHGRQLAAMDAILRTQGTFQIVRHSPATDHIALQISRNLCQYYSADTSVTTDYTSALEATGNIISVATGDTLPASFYDNHPVHIHKNEIHLRRPDGITKVYPYFPKRGLAAVFLRPLPLGRLELAVWGADEKSLALAARLVPLIPGSGQPDFVVMDQSMLAKGLEGTLALGFYDHDWEISSNAFLS